MEICVNIDEAICILDTICMSDIMILVQADSTETCCDRHLEIPGVSNNTTGTLEQKKTNSWTPVGQATDKKAPAQTN